MPLRRVRTAGLAWPASKRILEGMFGFLNVNKPIGPTSHDIVARARRLVGPHVKVGHAGTLDPFASGVLVVCVGAATRLARYVQATPKRYAAEVVLGATSTTDDPEGLVTPTPGAQPPAAEAVRRCLAGFAGEIRQVPPAHCAVWVGGRRAYKIARSGGQVDLAPRLVTIHAVELLRYEYPSLEIDVTCGSGTYIRSLARDIGAALGVGGHCARLTRTAVGVFRLETARPVEQIDPQRDLLPPLLGLADLPRVEVTPEQARRVARGRTISLSRPVPPGEVAAVGADSQLLAIAAVGADERTLRPIKVFKQD